MSEEGKKPSRRHQILEILALQLEQTPGQRITTASLAKAVGVSEAALYRHFPSKARMFEGLIEFIEETVFTLINQIMQEERGAEARCRNILQVVLTFSARNPGISRIMAGDALVGETERLRTRINQFYERIESQLKQTLREGELAGELPKDAGNPINANAELLLSLLEGRVARFVRSGFAKDPTDNWEENWQSLSGLLFRS